MTVECMLWRRLDAPGHDACRLAAHHDGWRLRGTAVFPLGAAPARLDYAVVCDARWITRRGRVRGWIGERVVRHEIGRAPNGDWTLDGAAVPAVHGCADLDLGFTPATNVLQLRRIGLAPGDAAAVSVAWLDVPDGGLSLLTQRYERLGPRAYRYEAPRFAYRATLETTDAEFVARYPGLWEAELGAAVPPNESSRSASP